MCIGHTCICPLEKTEKAHEKVLADSIPIFILQRSRLFIFTSCVCLTSTLFSQSSSASTESNQGHEVMSILRKDLFLKTTLRTNSVLPSQISKTVTNITHHKVSECFFSYRWWRFLRCIPCCEQFCGTSHVKLLSTTPARCHRVTRSRCPERVVAVEFFKYIYWRFEHLKLRAISSHYI